MESIWLGFLQWKVHVESRRNLWGRVKSSCSCVSWPCMCCPSAQANQTASVGSDPMEKHEPLSGVCQGTHFFFNISTVDSSFPSATFHFTSPYYSSMMSTIIPEHLYTSPSTTLSFLYFFIIFPSIPSLLAFLITPSTDLNGLLWNFYKWPLCLFLSLFLSSFFYVTMFHLYFQGLNFPFAYSHRLPPSRSLSFSLGISC